MKTAKQVILNTGDSWILEIKVYGVNKSPVRISKVKWRQLICTERGWEVQIRKMLSGCGQNRM